MTDLPGAASEGPAHPQTNWSLGVLADAPNRVILTALGTTRGRPMTARALTERFPPDTTPRLVRDRVRTLTRAGLLTPLEPAPGAPSDAPARWSLSPAGEELVSLHALMTRIASNGAALDAGAPARVRERVADTTLSALSDPVIVEVLRCLAEAGPLDPETLEARCRPTPRRTLYRRLDQAVAGGAVIRDTTRKVPRSTTYSIAERWRPAGAILLLAAWWDARHADLAGPLTSFDLEALLLGIQPVVKLPPRSPAGTLEIVVEDGGRGAHPVLLVDADGVRVLPGEAARAAADATRATGTVASWTAAIVNDRREGLHIAGDAAFASGTLTALRTALLSYIR